MKDARILVVDDEANIRMLLEEILSEEGYDVTTAENAAAARTARSEQDFELVLLDIWMPDTDGISLLKEWAREGSIGSVVVMSGHGTVDTAIEAIRIGALDFIEKPVSLVKLLRTVEKALAEHTGVRRQLVPPVLAPVGKSEPMQVLREQLTRIAGHDTHTLLTGEPGSGREACARYLASLSDRADAPFVVLKAGGRDDDKAVSLLGDDRGPGALERADGGVLFIGEITDMPSDTQRELLAVLEQGRFRSGGGTELQDLNVRILSSAPPDFEQSTDDFRRELLFHLSVVVVRVPHLRDYLEDVPELLRCNVDMLVD
ncbi:MAG: sigma-54-dependent Fis family transcriptional regulator, partial [Proteobacteria bacterium]|nr:sigma-54-dependent Fis family transcriptional regulator [Pseudomonadota bacterium]